LCSCGHARYLSATVECRLSYAGRECSDERAVGREASGKDESAAFDFGPDDVVNGYRYV
jgi:hypothetical protein